MLFEQRDELLARVLAHQQVHELAPRRVAADALCRRQRLFQDVVVQPGLHLLFVDRRQRNRWGLGIDPALARFVEHSLERAACLQT